MKVTKTMIDICNLRLTNGLSCRSCKFYGEACKGAEANIKQTGKATIQITKLMEEINYGIKRKVNSL